MECLSGPMKCLMLMGIILVMITVTLFLPIIGLPIDAVLGVFGIILGGDLLGLGKMFKGFGGILK
jgi:hypothetical protein